MELALHRNRLERRHIMVLLYGLVTVLAALVIHMAFAYADSGTVSGKIMELKEAVTIYSEKSEGSEVLVTFKAGDVIFVTGDTGDGWYTVAYQGRTGYLSKNVSGGTSASGTGASSVSAGGTHELKLEEFSGADPEVLDNELEQLNTESTYMVEEVERYHKSKRNAIIWVVIIALLAAALITVGIISYRKRSSLTDTDDKDKAERSNDGDTEPGKVQNITDMIDEAIIDLDKDDI